MAAFIGIGKLLDPHFETRTFRLEMYGDIQCMSPHIFECHTPRNEERVPSQKKGPNSRKVRVQSCGVGAARIQRKNRLLSLILLRCHLEEWSFVLLSRSWG